MSEQARTLGLPGQIDFEGKTLIVQRRTCAIEANFSLWLENNLTLALERSRPASSLAVYQERIRAGNEQLAARAFDPGEPVFNAALNSEVGIKEMAYLCIADRQTTWTRADHDRLWCSPGKAAETWRTILRISQPLPNGSAPGEEPTGGST